MPQDIRTARGPVPGAGEFRTADVCDAYGAEVQVCVLPLRSFGGRRRFTGIVETVHCHEDVGLVRQVVSSPGRERVLVIDGACSLRTALLGGQLAEQAVDAGWVGIVVAGAVRDLTELAALQLGVLALGACPRRSSRDGAGGLGGTVTLGGAAFVPGARVWADEDGLVVSSTVVDVPSDDARGVRRLDA